MMIFKGLSKKFLNIVDRNAIPITKDGSSPYGQYVRLMTYEAEGDVTNMWVS